MRVTQLFGRSGGGGLIAGWTVPDAGIELRAMAAGDSAFQPVGEDSPLKVRVFRPGTALEGSRVLLRAPRGVAGRRAVTVRLTLVRPGDPRPSLIDREVTIDRDHRVIPLVIRNGQLVDDPTPLPEGEAPAPYAPMD